MPKIKKIIFVILNVQEKIIKSENKNRKEKYAKINQMGQGVQKASMGVQIVSQSQAQPRFHFISNL